MSGTTYPCKPRTQLQRIRSRVTLWSLGGRRRLPWHDCGDPYKVFVAEVLVRKTRAIDALPVYEAVTLAYPTIVSLSQANPTELRQLIEPIGLPNRAETLIDGAKHVDQQLGGRIPDDPTDLMLLKGVGRYTANAVACIAYGRTVPMIDEGAGRVIRRLLGVQANGPANQDRNLWSWAEKLVPPKDPVEFNLSLLHLSQEICRPRRPKCGICPLETECASAGIVS